VKLFVASKDTNRSYGTKLENVKNIVLDLHSFVVLDYVHFLLLFISRVSS
jgi:hypothetical protein